MIRRPKVPLRKQPTPQELLDHLADFIERKFYAGRPIDFTKDRGRLLEWVILWPAGWLAKVIQSYFAIHGDELYEEAKTMRNLVEHAAETLGRLSVRQAPDPVAELDRARRLLISDRKAKKSRPKPPVNPQLNLF